MIRRPPGSTRTDTLFPSPTLFRSFASAHGLTPRGRIVAFANMGGCPTLMLDAPVPAAKKVLARAGLTQDDIDLWEINEAFAVVAEKFIRDLDLDRDRATVNGGEIALRHPTGHTGAIPLSPDLDHMELHRSPYGHNRKAD